MFNLNYLTFSDGAKFALVARSLFEGKGFATTFSFWGDNLFGTTGIPYLVPHIINMFFKLFGPTDQAVIYFSLFFFLALVVAVYFLGKKLHGNTAGILAALAVLLNINFIDYATSGASETLFAFEIVLAVYLLSFASIWINAAGFFVLVLMYFTRPQAFIFMAGLALFWLIKRLGFKKGALTFIGLGVIGFLVDKFIIYPLSFKYPLTPVIVRGLQSIFTYSSFNAVSDGLRGAASSTLSISDVAKKVFYNLYNFYKAIPEILNPYLFTLFIIGLFKKQTNTLLNSYKITSLFLVAFVFLVTALTIPFYRYLHPVVPLIYLLAVITFIEIIKALKIKQIFGVVAFIVLVVGQTLGYILLDSRFEAARVNPDKPPVYVVLSQNLKEITEEDELVVTNLDTWGSWYGQRRTVWFPLTPEMLIQSVHEYDAIYLTSYRMNDENYYMGDEWRQIFDDPSGQVILPEYEFAGEYVFSASENYQREEAKAILLRKKSVE